LKGTNSALTQNIAVNCDAGRVDDHHIEIHHLSPHTNSSLCVNSACANKGHAIGTGLLIIEENCDGSDAGQVFKNLLLSENAKAEAIPELEVLSDDVSAAHGAASSSVDPEQIHYLMARGFSPEDAKTEILEGFLISSFAKLSNEKTRQFLMEGLTVKAD
jgi:Fe-S cluster assembly protein SufD